MAAISELYSKRKLDWRLNVSFLKLIPKKEDSATVKDFRPLSLISIFYKIVCKLLAERIKTVMPGLISNAQGAFVKNRQILEGILITHELIDSRLRQQRPGILCKIDVQKDFDNIMLSLLINKAVEQEKLSGFQVKVVSHLQFADDTVVFVDASTEEVRRLLVILVVFEILTGLRLNLEKGTMISVGADEKVNDLAMELGCKVESIPITYLGIPIGSNRRSNLGSYYSKNAEKVGAMEEKILEQSW
ncbi:uncharacterized protein LOC113295133 [Papaver somniferum]|uniref:uncharacterized protein LOC113295133 n=1 Tax=Papaver somniferum TaxID=3469 RepID=UPI000E702924|nr:uncharacterized protein LOC113295133 [Papaver somniferum]